MKCSNPNCNRSLAWSSIGAGGSASGVTVQGIATMPSWLIWPNSHTKSRVPQATSSGSSRNQLGIHTRP